MARDGIPGRGHRLSNGMEPGNRGKLGLQRKKHSNGRAEYKLEMEASFKVERGASEWFGAGECDEQSCASSGR